MERISNEPKHNLLSGVRTSERQTRERVATFDSMVNQQIQLKDEVNQRSADKLSQKDSKTALGQNAPSDDDDRKYNRDFTTEAPEEQAASEWAPIPVQAPEANTTSNLSSDAQIAAAEFGVEVEVEDSELADANPESLLAAGAQAEQPIEKLPTRNLGDGEAKAAEAAKSPLSTPDALTPGAQAKPKTDADPTAQKMTADVTQESAEELVSRPNATLTSATAAEIGKEVQDKAQPDASRSDKVVADLKAAAEKAVVQGANNVEEEADTVVVKSTQTAPTETDADAQQQQPRPDAQAAAAAASQRPAPANSAAQQAKPVAVTPIDASSPSNVATQNTQTANAKEATRSQTPQQSRQAAQQQPVADQVAIQIRKAVKEGMDRIQIQLEPADLGRIDVTMEVANDGKVMAVLKADNPETLDLMMKDARSLERALADAGLDVDSNSLEFQLSDQGAGQGTQDENELANFVGADLVAASEAEEFMDVAVEGDSDYGLMADGDGLDLYA